jgi:hypothetical protein
MLVVEETGPEGRDVEIVMFYNLRQDAVRLRKPTQECFGGM